MFSLFKKNSNKSCCNITFEEVKDDCCQTEQDQACCGEDEVQNEDSCCDANHN
ncbi:hypothetical protein [Litchfieldia alkalitelluris]|uniref:hypothetical protein n=1 Tax=Litchfieldia alkalitelluris TaxID=304268 RepID=UPI00147280BE|nr:hypothetical protein [Litchfieldia alkalitelluris]